MGHGPATSLLRFGNFCSRAAAPPSPIASFRWLMVLCALSIFAIVALIFSELVLRSQLTIAKFGIKFFFGSAWDPVNGNFGALPFVYGTLASSLIALVIAVPLAVGVAIFITEMCPQDAARPSRLRHRVAGRDSQHRLRRLGGIRARPVAARARQSRSSSSSSDGLASSPSRTSASACLPPASSSPS